MSSAFRTVLVGVALLVASSARAEYIPIPDFRNVQLGAVADFELTSTSGGLSVLGSGGAEYVGIEVFREGRLLVQWDALLTVRGGIIGNTLPPFTSLIGGHTLATVEAGYRFQHGKNASFYMGARLNGDLSIMAHPGLSLSQLDRLNAMDSVGGVVAHGDVRVDLGLSWIRTRHSLLVVAFLEEAGYIPGVYTPGLSFTEGGIEVRYDLMQHVTATVDAYVGRGPVRSDSALDTKVQSSTAGIQALVRGVLNNGCWLAVSGGYHREFDHRTYHASTVTYDTKNAPDIAFQLLLGIPFEWHKHRRPRP